MLLHISAEFFEDALVFGHVGAEPVHGTFILRLMRVHPFLQNCHCSDIPCIVDSSIASIPSQSISKACFKPDAGPPNHSTQMAGFTLCNLNCSPEDSSSLDAAIVAGQLNAGAAKGYRLE